MKTLEYKIKIDGDDSGLRKAIENSDAKLQKLNENDYLIKLKYDGNAESLKKIIQRISKQAPELGIKFQYDLNKKAFEAQKAKLDKMEFQVSISENAEALAEETKKSFERLKNELKNAGYTDLGQIINSSELPDKLWNTKQLRPFIEEFLQYSNALEKITGKLDKQFEELAYSFDTLPSGLPTEASLKKQQGIVSGFEKELQKLSEDWKKTGLPQEALEMPKELSISITADTEQFDSEIKRIKQELDELPDKKTIQIEVDGSEALKQVFSDDKNLKAGESDAAVAAPVSDFSLVKSALESDISKKELGATVSIEPENVSEFRNKIQKELDALPPVQVNAEPVVKKPEHEILSEASIMAPVEVAVGNTEDFVAKIRQAVDTASPIPIEIAPQLSDDKLNDVVKSAKEQIEKAAVEAQSKAAAAQAKKKAAQARPASWSMMAQAEQENEAFDKLKAALGASPTSDKGSFTKQWKDYQKEAEKRQKEIEKAQAEAIKENEAFDKLKAIQSNYTKPIFNNNDSYVKQLEAYEKGQSDRLKDINKMMAQLERGATRQNRPAQYLESLRDIKTQVDEINNKPLDFTNAGDVNRLEQMQSDLKNMVTETSKLKENRSGNSVKLASLLEQLTNTRYRYSGMSSEFDSAYASRIEEVQGLLNNPGRTTAKDVEDITLSVKRLDAQLAASGTKTKGFFDTVSERLTGANAQFIVQYMSIQDFIRYAHSAIDTVVSLDSSITELRKVSDASEFRLGESFKTATETGKELGSTIKDIINLTADWSRLGYSVDEAEKLARITALFKNVGDGISTDEASSYMISTLKGFQLETDYAQRMVDVYNELGNNFAISSGEVGEALQRSAASLNAANTSFEKSAALVTATNEIVQDADSVGNMWKTNITVFRYRNVLIRKYLIAGKA